MDLNTMILVSLDEAREGLEEVRENLHATEKMVWSRRARETWTTPRTASPGSRR